MTSAVDTVYVEASGRGNCKICGATYHLEYGVCFDCRDRVRGSHISPTIYRLTDEFNPDNVWYYEGPMEYT